MPQLAAGGLIGGGGGAAGAGGLAGAGGGLTALGSLGSAAALGAVSLLGGKGLTAAENRDAAQAAYEQTLGSQRQSAIQQYGSMLQRQQQERAALVANNNEITRRAAQALSATIAQTGGTGETAFNLLADVHRQRLAQQGALLQQQHFQEQQQVAANLGIQSQAYQAVIKSFYQIPSRSSVYSAFGQDVLGAGKTGLSLAAL